MSGLPGAPSRSQCLIAIGDSIVLGHWDTIGAFATALRREADALVNATKRGYYGVAYNLGISSNTSTHVRYRYESEVAARMSGYELALFVVIGVGINDSLYDPISKTCEVELSDYADNMRALLAQVINGTKAVSKASGVVVLGLPPVDERVTRPVPWKNPPREYHNDLIAEYNAIANKVATETQVPFVDLFSELRIWDASLLHHDWDGVHPNAFAHGLIDRLVRAELTKLKWGVQAPGISAN